MAGETPSSLRKGRPEANCMSNFWMALVAAQTTAADTKPASRRRQILSVVGGIALALLIGAGLFIAAALTL